MSQESLVSHGCVKAEAVAAEQLMRSLLAPPEDSDASVRPTPGAPQTGKAAASSTSASTASPRDASAAIAAGAAESEAASPAAAKDSGSISARAALAAAAYKAVNGVTAAPREAKELLDYDMFEQIWMADLTAVVPRAG